MARRKIEERNIRSLTRISNGSSYVVSLPIDVIRRWDWQHKQKLELEIDDKRKCITIKDWKK